VVVSVVLSSSSAVQISDTVREQWVSALAARVCSPVRVMLHPRVTWSTNLASAAWIGRSRNPVADCVEI